MSKDLSIVLPTTLALINRFQSTLSAPHPPTTSAASASSDLTEKDALPLLSASSTALKSQVTKLSLLAITSPLTESAICSVLTALNESVLPSLVTAALLVSPGAHTTSFHKEITSLTNVTLKELAVLVGEVKTIASKKDAAKKAGQKEGELNQSEKDTVTVATGRAWDSCDVLVDVASKGVVGFVVRRVEEWRDLVKDAVQEIEEWDPEEEGDEFFDELLSDDEKDGEAKDDEEEDEDDEETALANAHKKSTLRTLKPIAQIYPSILTNRLKNAGNAPLTSPSGIPKLESLMLYLKNIPENIDEVAGALYEINLEKSNQYLGKVRDGAFKALNLLALPWGIEGEEKGDKFTTWSKTWMRVMEEISKSDAK